MKNNLKIFNNSEFGMIGILILNNKEYFSAVECAEKLGYSNPHDAIKKHCKEKGVAFHEVLSNGGIQKKKFIDEGNLYRLITKSRLPKSEKFEEWIFDEVLPTIRKHGAYLTDEKIEEVLTNPDTIIKLATQLKEERQKRIELQLFKTQLEGNKQLLLVREVAKIASKNGIVIGEKRLYTKLREWGLIFKKSTEPKQEYVDRGYFEVIERTKNKALFKTTKVTGKGQAYIIDRLIKENNLK